MTHLVVTRWARIVLVGLLALAPCGVLSAAAAGAATDCAATGEPADPEITAVPWPQQRLEPERVWPLTTGRGVTVAVIDSGIDASRPQLNGQVVAGRDFLGSPGGPSTADCAGHGTQVAGIIAAKPLPGYPFHGVAPGARLLSIRAYEQVNEVARGSAGTLAEAIREAVARGARVVNVSVATGKDDPQLRAAVAFALAHDVVIVAAAAGDDDTVRAEPAADAVYWPARYDGVIAVTSTNKEGKQAAQPHSASYVDVAAPGAEVVTTGANGPHRYAQVSGAGFAAAFVSGTAALIRSYYPRLTAAQVTARITATAEVPPQGRDSAGLGAGIVNPYAAVTAIIPAEGAAPSLVPVPEPAPLPVLLARPDHTVRNRALVCSAIGAGLALLVILAAVVLPRGRAGRWQPRRPGPPVGP